LKRGTNELFVGDTRPFWWQWRADNHWRKHSDKHFSTPVLFPHNWCILGIINFGHNAWVDLANNLVSQLDPSIGVGVMEWWISLGFIVRERL
jgi:hypothetical protein